MQDYHISQIQEQKQLVATREQELKEINLRATHSNLLAKEIIDAQEQAREAQMERDIRIQELA